MRAGHVQGEVSVGERVTGMCGRTAALGALCERAAKGGRAEAETMGGRIVMGPTCRVTGFNM